MQYLNIPDLSGDPHRFARTERLHDFSLASLTRVVDEAFMFYLERELKNFHQPWQLQGLEPWKEIVQHKSLSRVLREVHRDLALDDTASLPLEEIPVLLKKFGDTLDIVCFEKGIGTEYLKERGWETSPLGAALWETFDVPEGDLREADPTVPYRFFNYYLLKEYLFSTAPSDQEVARKRALHTAFEFSGACHTTLSLVLATEEMPEKRVLLLHNLLRLRQREHSLERMEQFHQGIESMAEAVQGDAKRIPAAVEELIKTVFPDLWIPEIIQEKAKYVALGEGHEKPIKEIVPPENFYFTDEITGPLSAEEWAKLPPEGNLVADRLHETLVAGHTNVSLFDSTGCKVFWGDLLLRHITELKGPLYVLSQSNSYFDVTEWARGATRVALDPSRPEVNLVTLGVLDGFKEDTVRIDTGYMRLVALGKIVDGKYVENPREIGEI